MPTGNVCIGCGAEIPIDAPNAQCTRCLFNFAMGLQPEGPHGWIGQIGSYEISDEIARGGMGVIYRARHIATGQEVALKMLQSGLFASEDVKRRFQNEATAASKLDHPNIVPIYEVGEDAGLQFYTMKLIHGSNLSNMLSSQRFSREESVRLIATLSFAVHYAHENGVIHRDIKPANILIDRFGKAYIVDFGLAKIMDDPLNLTRTVAVLGTPTYLSPEQARGATREANVRTDIYSLGAMLYELLTGRPPFLADTTYELLQRIINQEPLAPERLNPEIDRDLSAICLKTLRKDPAERYASAGELGRDLMGYLSFDTPSILRKTTLIGRLRRFFVKPRTVRSELAADWEGK